MIRGSDRVEKVTRLIVDGGMNHEPRKRRKALGIRHRVKNLKPKTQYLKPNVMNYELISGRKDD